MSDGLYLVEHLTQIGTGANNCGPATGEMLRRLYRPSLRRRVQDARALMGGYGQFTTAQGIRDYNNRGRVPCVVTDRADFDYYVAALASRRPVIALVDYRAFPVNPPPTLRYAYEYAHFILVIGMRNGLVYYHDPLYLTGPQSMPAYNFNLAISSRSRYIGGTNDPYIAIVPVYPYSRAMEIRGKYRALLEAYN